MAGSNEVNLNESKVSALVSVLIPVDYFAVFEFGFLACSGSLFFLFVLVNLEVAVVDLVIACVLLFWGFFLVDFRI